MRELSVCVIWNICLAFSILTPYSRLAPMDKSDGPCAGVTRPAMVRISKIASHELPQSKLLEGKSDGAIKSETILSWFVLWQIKSRNLSVADLNEVLNFGTLFDSLVRRDALAPWNMMIGAALS